jgi:hypothetical protein
MIRYLLAALASLSFILATPAFAAQRLVVTSPVTGPSAQTIDPGDVTSGAAVSVDIDTSYFRTMNCQLRNPDGATRVFTASCKNGAGNTAYSFIPTVSVASGAYGQLNFDPEASLSTSAGAGQIWAITPCRNINIAAPAVSGSAGVICTLKSH